MRFNFVVFFTLLSFTAFAREIGYQYNYQCSSSTTNFSIQVFTKGGTRTAAIYKDEYLNNPHILKFNPRLGSEKTILTFDTDQDGQEDQFECALTYTNAY
jgi:hypothetical protein